MENFTDAAVFLFICAAFAAPVDDENVQAAQFMPMGMMPPMMGMNQMMMDPMFGMGYPGMMNMYPGYPGMGGMQMYSSKREDYPIDYNQGCSSSCSCVSSCRMTWWMPCNCM